MKTPLLTVKQPCSGNILWAVNLAKMDIFWWYHVLHTVAETYDVTIQHAAVPV